MLVPGLSSLPTQRSDQSVMDVDSAASSQSMNDYWDLADESTPQLLFQKEVSMVSPAKDFLPVNREHESSEDIFVMQNTFTSVKRREGCPPLTPFHAGLSPLGFPSPFDYPATSSLTDIPRVLFKVPGAREPLDGVFSPPGLSKWTGLSDSTFIDPLNAETKYTTKAPSAPSPPIQSPDHIPSAPHLGTVPLPSELGCSPKALRALKSQKMPLYIHDNVVSVCLPAIFQEAEPFGGGKDMVGVVHKF
jgi:hypothetical protein